MRSNRRGPVEERKRSSRSQGHPLKPAKKGEDSKTGHSKIISLFDDESFYPNGKLLPSPEAGKQGGGGKKKNVRKYNIKYKYLKNNKYANI